MRENTDRCCTPLPHPRHALRSPRHPAATLTLPPPPQARNAVWRDHLQARHRAAPPGAAAQDGHAGAGWQLLYDRAGWVGGRVGGCERLGCVRLTHWSWLGALAWLRLGGWRWCCTGVRRPGRAPPSPSPPPNTLATTPLWPLGARRGCRPRQQRLWHRDHGGVRRLHPGVRDQHREQRGLQVLDRWHRRHCQHLRRLRPADRERQVGRAGAGAGWGGGGEGGAPPSAPPPTCPPSSPSGP